MITKFKNMKYFESFESTQEPQIGDYVICDLEWKNWLGDFDNYIKTNIGQIIDKKTEYSVFFAPRQVRHNYTIKYQKNLTQFGNDTKYLNRSTRYIKYWFKNKKDAKDHLLLMKQKEIYNL